MKRINRVVDTTYLKRIDSTQSVKEIDLGISPEGFHENRPMSGIYKLEENQLTYCWAHPNEARPTEFRAEPGGMASFWRMTSALRDGVHANAEKNRKTARRRKPPIGVEAVCMGAP